MLAREGQLAVGSPDTSGTCTSCTSCTSYTRRSCGGRLGKRRAVARRSSGGPLPFGRAAGQGHKTQDTTTPRSRMYAMCNTHHLISIVYSHIAPRARFDFPNREPHIHCPALDGGRAGGAGYTGAGNQQPTTKKSATGDPRGGGGHCGGSMGQRPKTKKGPGPGPFYHFV
jgi:hypothetical protein